MSDKIIGRIETDPAKFRHEDVYPGMRCIWSRAIVILTTAVKIPGDVSSGDPYQAEQGEHGVCKILAHAATIKNRFIDRRIDPS